MAKSYTSENITASSVLTEEEKRAFDKEFAEASASQAPTKKLLLNL